jgi:hypothetical protein
MDWMPLLGLCVPFPWNIALFLTKPQIGLGWILLHLSKRYPYSGHVMAALVSLTAIVLALTGNRLTDAYWNTPLGPDVMTVALGAYLAFKITDENAAWIGPLLSPYLSYGSYAGIFLALANDWRIILVDIIAWSLLVIRLFL